MKIRILILLTLISMSCFSQSISDFKINCNPIINPITFQFKVNHEDSISLKIINIMGIISREVIKKDLFKTGTYKVEFTMSTVFPVGTYIVLLSSSNIELLKEFVNQGVIGSSKTLDYVKITYLDSIKIFDTTKVAVFDTTKVLIIDTLNCVKTTTNLRNYDTFPVSESIVFHDNLTINFSSVDNLVIYDLSGKFIRRLSINSNLINLQDLKNGIYVGLFYENGDLIRTIKMIKE